MAMTPIKAAVRYVLYLFKSYVVMIMLQIPVMYRAITSGSITMMQPVMYRAITSGPLQ